MESDKNILIVDDVSIMRSIISKIVKKIGINNILMAENGLKALEVLESNKVDAVLLDIIMPRMNGLELLKKMKDNDNYKDIPVIIISSDASKETKEHVNKLGVFDYINKPFKGSDIILKLQTLI